MTRHPGVEVVIPVDGDDGEVGEEDEDVGDDVADEEEGPGVEHVRVTGGQEVHRAGVKISLVHISTMSEWRYPSSIYHIICENLNSLVRYRKI